jgi:hypothetical protein
MIPSLEALLQDYVDTPDWEKDLDNPARALSHQMLVSIAAIIELREVLCDRINELLRNHDNHDDLSSDLNFVEGEIVDELQRALHGTGLGKQCQAHEMGFGLTLEALRKTGEGQ